jgi:hypothetical protein
MPPLLEALEQFNIEIPEYSGSHPFSKSQQPRFYKEIGDTAEGKTARTDFFERNLIGLYLALGRAVPYTFRTKDGSIRSLDAGCVKFLCNRKEPELEPVRDAEHYIIAVKPLAPLLARYESTRDAVTKPYLELTRKLSLPFDLSSPVDERRRVLSEQVIREGAAAFRQSVFRAWEGRCAISRVAVKQVLEAAHIFPYLGAITNDLRNAILLKSDLHILFDAHLISVEYLSASLVVRTSHKLIDTPYAKYEGKIVKLPTAIDQQPAPEVVAHHLKQLAAPTRDLSMSKQTSW